MKLCDGRNTGLNYVYGQSKLQCTLKKGQDVLNRFQHTIPKHSSAELFLLKEKIKLIYYA